MGQMLGTAVSSQYIQRYGSASLRVGSSHMQGCRPTMEDADTVLLELPAHPRVSFFGVYDGHAGEEVSEYLSSALAEKINALADPMDPESVKAAVLETDADIGERKNIRQSGSTACFVLLERPEQEGEPFRLLSGNVGDSRSMILRADGSTFDALTSDHKPDIPAEAERISAAGGHVSMGRVDGQLAMSRAMGDFGYKENSLLGPELQKVTAVADVALHEVRPGDSVLVFCDGVVEQLTNEQVAEFVFEQLAGKGLKQGHGGPLAESEGFTDPADPGAVVYNLLHHSVTSGSLDNHSAMLIQLADGSAYAREPEFVAGPFTPFKGDAAFREAYIKDAKVHGIEDPELIPGLSLAAEEKLPEHVRTSRPDPSEDPLQILRMVASGRGGSDEELENRLNLLELLSGGQIRLIRPGDPGYDEGDEAEDPEDEEDEADDSDAEPSAFE